MSTIFDKNRCYRETVEKDIILHFAHLSVVWLKRSRSSLRSFLCPVDVDWKTPVCARGITSETGSSVKIAFILGFGDPRGSSDHTLKTTVLSFLLEQQCRATPWTSKSFYLLGGKNWNSSWNLQMWTLFSGFFFLFLFNSISIMKLVNISFLKGSLLQVLIHGYWCLFLEPFTIMEIA